MAVSVSLIVMGEVVVVGEFPHLVVHMMNNYVFLWVSTTTPLFKIVLNHPTGQTLLAKRALGVIIKVIPITICKMAHCITVADVVRHLLCALQVITFC